PMKLPLAENFSSPQLDASWSRAVSSGATIVSKDGWLTCEGAPTARALIERSAGVDNFTISATAARWAVIYVVWDENNWCAVGKILPTPFGRFFSVDVHGGAVDEIDHRGVDFNAPSPVRMQIGTDHIRFQYLDGREWR